MIMTPLCCFLQSSEGWSIIGCRDRNYILIGTLLGKAKTCRATIGNFPGLISATFSHKKVYGEPQARVTFLSRKSTSRVDLALFIHITVVPGVEVSLDGTAPSLALIRTISFITFFSSSTSSSAAKIIPFRQPIPPYIVLPE